MEREKNVNEQELRAITREALTAAGGVAVVRAELRLSKAAAYHWIGIPPKHLAFFMRKLNRTAAQLRPDLFDEAATCAGEEDTAEKLRRLLEIMSEVALAEKLGCSQATVSRIKNGAAPHEPVSSRIAALYRHELGDPA